MSQQLKTKKQARRILIASAPVADPDTFNAADRPARKAARAARHAPQSGPATIAGLTLVNAHTNSDFTTLANGMTVDLAQVGSRFVSVRAATGGEASSVVFTLDGRTMKPDDN